MNTSEKVSILSVITTRDSSGHHFAEKFDSRDLAELESEGLIAITRPVHSTGIPYDETTWSVEVTEAGVALVEANPEDCASE